MSPPAPEDRWPSVIAEEKTAHSAKPVAVYEMIEQAFPNARRLELFARDRRDGWTVWGNEVEPSSTGTDPC
jgi:N6-adenosine-specific RNA methylase IME4